MRMYSTSGSRIALHSDSKSAVLLGLSLIAGEKVRYEGSIFQLPLPDSEGKPISIAHEPASVPVYLATLGPSFESHAEVREL